MSGNDLLDQFLAEPDLSPVLAARRAFSSFGLALRDARVAAGRDPKSGQVIAEDPSTKWLGAIGYMTLMDLAGSVLRRTSRPISSHLPTGGPKSGLLCTLESFSTLDERDRDVIYSLRNALVHDYSLLSNRAHRKHLFKLTWEDSGSVVINPTNAWNGLLDSAPEAERTVVNLAALVVEMEKVVHEIFACYACFDLHFADDIEEWIPFRYLMWYYPERATEQNGQP